MIKLKYKSELVLIGVLYIRSDLRWKFLTFSMSNDAEWKLNCINSSWSPKSSRALTTTGCPTSKKTEKDMMKEKEGKKEGRKEGRK